MKTKEEIQKEVGKLKELLPNIRATSAFGTDNKAQLAAQIGVLEGNLSNNDICDRYDHSGIDEETHSAALEARQWLDGEYEEDTLSEDWEGLRQ